jgi:cytochrome P450
MRTRAQAAADALLDAMTAAGPAADLLADFAVPLTFAVLTDLFGVPPGERERFTTWAGAVMSTSTAAAGKAGEYAGRLRAGLAAQLRRRRREPSDDLPGVLARAAQEGHLSERQLPAEAIGLLVLAFETTTAQLVNCVTALQSQPGGWQHVCAAPAAVPAAVEELLRFLPLSTMAGSPRYATEDVELDGAVVRAGEPVLVALAAANRDERVFVDGERLDLTRDPNPHLGFGAGVHHCLGALPARMTLQVGLGTLATRLPRLRPAAGDVTWSTRSFVRRPEALPVRW